MAAGKNKIVDRWFVLCGMIAFMCLAAAGSGMAQDAEPATEDEDATEEIVVRRNPFWPIGFDPNAKEAEPVKPEETAGDPADAVKPPIEEEVAVDWAGAEKKLKVGTIAGSGDRVVALINGKWKGKGEYVTVDHGKLKYSWQILGLDAKTGQVRLKKEWTRSADLEWDRAKQLE